MADDSPSLLGIVHGKPNKQQLFFIPCDDENPTNTSHEISEHVLLLNKKRIINIDECNKSGETSLHIAAKASNVTTARHLLAKGADINRRDKDGITPLLLAEKFAKRKGIDRFVSRQ